MSITAGAYLSCNLFFHLVPEAVAVHIPAGDSHFLMNHNNRQRNNGNFFLRLIFRGSCLLFLSVSVEKTLSGQLSSWRTVQNFTLFSLDNWTGAL
jgi:hypothetical protein